MKRAQAALDFLMTYGWALLLIVLVVGALFALGIFDIGTFLGSRSSGFPQITPSAWRLEDNGNFSIKFKNHAGTDINVTSINATWQTQTINYSSSFNLGNSKESSTIIVGAFSSPPAKGTSYTVQVSINYIDKATNFAYTDSGTLTGKVN